MSLLVLSSADVSKISSEIDPVNVLNLMALVFARLTLKSGVLSPHRTSILTSCHNVLVMPSYIVGSGAAVKVVSVPTSPNDSRGLPASTFVIDEESGAVKAIVNARKLTALRNAAGIRNISHYADSMADSIWALGSTLATKLALGSSAKPKSLVAFGAGEQIEAHIDLFLRTFSESLTVCAIFNRTMSARLDNLISSLRNKFRDVTFIAKSIPSVQSPAPLPEEEQDLKEIIGAADIICTATSSTRPLFPGCYVKPNTHINLIGSYKPSMIEIDKNLVNRAGTIIVDSKEACLVEAGDLISAGVRQDNMIELGELVEFEGLSENPIVGRIRQEGFRVVEEKCRMIRSKGDVTIFKSVGVGVQDAAIASLVVQFAEERNVGTRVGSYDL